MLQTFKTKDRNYRFDPSAPIEISIPLNFNGDQPNAFGVEPATSAACVAGELIGDTRRGGSCNFEQYTFIPHCNGTHTECVGHITNERISVRDCLRDSFVLAALITVEPTAADNGDPVITKSSIERSISGKSVEALTIRTLPNDDSKLTRRYIDKIPPYFAHDAMTFIVQQGIRHLLVDMPSIDRLFDEGRLLNHRIFWNVEEGKFETNENTRRDCTITELIYVPNEVEDGPYLLNLQIAPFASDASPSRPILFKLIED
jgi:kynurenine formamidase